MSQVSTVSVIVPCRNEHSHIEHCLSSILQTDFDGEIELIVVDGMSTDGTREIVTEFAKEDKRILLLDNPKHIVSTALNIGIQKARGEIIVRMDAHSEYPPDYIKRCVALLLNTGAGNAGGRVVNVANGFGFWAEAVRYVTGHVFGVGNSAFRTSHETDFVDTVPFGTFKREVFQKVGLFDERLTRNQDNEFNDRVRQAGYKIAFDPTICIRYKNQPTLIGLMRQGYHTGRWNVFTLKLFPYTFKLRRFVPLGLVGYLLLVAILAAFRILNVIAYLPLMCYMSLAIWFSISAPLRLKDRIATLITFWGYHISYGIGTFMGFAQLGTGVWKKYLGTPLA